MAGFASPGHPPVLNADDLAYEFAQGSPQALEMRTAMPIFTQIASEAKYMRVNPVYVRSLVSILLTIGAASLLAAPAAAASSCSAEMHRTRIAVDNALDQHAAAAPFAPESNFAKTRHQPTPSTIARAESKFDDWPNGSEAVAALRRARQANKRGDSEGCLDALREAHIAIGANP
jgi:hypothetical protein